MKLQIVRPGESVSPAELAERGADAVLLSAADTLPPAAPGSLRFVSVDAVSPEGQGACKTAADLDAVLLDAAAVAAPQRRLIVCPNRQAQQELVDKRVQAAARLPGDGVALDAPDAWYAAGLRGAGFCDACDSHLSAFLHDAYGEMYVDGPVLPAIAAAEDGLAPFWRERDAFRLKVGVEHGARLIRRVRDEARLIRNAETQVGAKLLGISPVAIKLASKLDFVMVPAPTPAPDRSRVATYELFRAALAQRPVVGMLDPQAATSPGLVRQAARLASAVGAEITLPATAPSESHAALAAHRRFWTEFRSRYRPADKLAEALLLYSPECDHWTRGQHGGGVRAVAEALTRLGAQYRIVLSVPRTGTEPVILADATAIPEEDAARLEKRVTEGASALVVGTAGAVSDDGRALDGPFPELSSGLNRVGAGTIFVADLQAPAAGTAERRWEPLVSSLEKGLESLLGRGRRAASVSKPSVVVKMYLDPERKLDVHLIGRQFDPVTGAAEEVKGLSLYLAGSAVSGARTGYLFTAEGPERKVSLTPYGMGVQATLPDFVGSAVLAVAR